MTQVTKSDYEDVRKSGDVYPIPNPKVAQEFCDAIDLGTEFQQIEKVYCLEDFSLENHYLKSSNPLSCMEMINYVGTKTANLYGQVLLVHPYGFKSNFKGFMNTARHHECHHARQYWRKEARLFRVSSFAKNPENQKYVSLLFEIPAFLNQLSIDGELSVRDYPVCQALFPQLDDSLLQEATKLGRDWKSDLSKILCASPYDDVVRERYSL